MSSPISNRFTTVALDDFISDQHSSASNSPKSNVGIMSPAYKNQRNDLYLKNLSTNHSKIIAVCKNCSFSFRVKNSNLTMFCSVGKRKRITTNILSLIIILPQIAKPVILYSVESQSKNRKDQRRKFVTRFMNFNNRF